MTKCKEHTCGRCDGHGEHRWKGGPFYPPCATCEGTGRCPGGAVVVSKSLIYDERIDALARIVMCATCRQPVTADEIEETP